MVHFEGSGHESILEGREVFFLSLEGSEMYGPFSRIWGQPPPPHTHAPCTDMVSAWGTQQVHNLFLETKHDPGSRGQLPPTVKYYDDS